MTKAELVDQVAATVHLSKAQTDAVLTQCLQAIIEALQAGESVELRGFGRFHLRHRQPRTGRNPLARGDADAGADDDAVAPGRHARARPAEEDEHMAAERIPEQPDAAPVS